MYLTSKMRQWRWISPDMSAVANPLVYDTLAQAQAATIPSYYNSIRLNGYYAAGDGGGGLYARTVSPPTYGTFTSADGAHWVLAENFRNLLMFGGKPDNGVTDNAPFLTAANSFGPFSVDYPDTNVTYGVNSNVTITTTITFPRNTMLKPANGVTITLANVIASRSQIFANATAGQGTIVLDNTSTGYAYPEWWGAQGNMPTVDCAPAINAALAAWFEIHLAAGAYYIQSPVIMTQNGRTLRGVASTENCCTSSLGGPGNNAVDPNATQLVLTSASAYGIQVGAVQSTNPGSLTTNITIENLTIVRATASVPLGVSGAAAIDNPVSGFSIFTETVPCGVVCCWLGLCRLNNVFTVEHSIGVYIYGCVECFFDRVRHLRYTPGQNAGNDFWAGFFQDNSAPSGYNSGNASIYYDECQGFSNTTIGGAPAYTYNAFIESYQGFTDTWVTGCESGLTNYGVDFEGRQTTAYDTQTEDLFITGCKFDSARTAAIKIAVGGPGTAVTVTNNYLAVTSATGPSSLGIHLLNIHGSAVVAENQVIGGAGNSATGLYYDTCSGIRSYGNILTDMSAGVSILNCFTTHIYDLINQASQSINTAAVIISNLNTGIIEPQVYASGSGLNSGIGVSMDSSCTLVDVSVSGIDSASTGGNKLYFSGSKVTSAGTYSWGLARGIF